jgi:hypothetical protein
MGQYFKYNIQYLCLFKTNMSTFVSIGTSVSRI